MSTNTPNQTPAGDNIKAPAPAPAAVVTDAELMRENAMLRSRVELREKQLQEAIDVANRANTEASARQDAEKARLIDSIVLDSKFRKEDLANKALPELQTMRLTLDKSIIQSFANVAAEMEAATKPKLMGVDYWDPKAAEWRVK